MKQPEKKCPQCQGPIDWKVVRNDLSVPAYNGWCKKCNIILKGREAPDITKGKKLAHELKGVHFMDKKITQHNADVQVGILRERQHCAKCSLPDYAGKYCKCKNCKCLYCSEHKAS